MGIESELHRLERKVISFLENHHSLKDIVKTSGLEEVEAVRALGWLSDKKLCVLDEEKKEFFELDSNGKLYSDKGLPERRFLEALKEKKNLSSVMEDADLTLEEANASIGVLKRNEWIQTEKGKETLFEISEKGKQKLEEGFEEELFLKKAFPLNLDDLTEEEVSTAKFFEKRKLVLKKIVKKTLNARLTKKGEMLVKDVSLDEEVTDQLTPELIKSGEWSKTKFREYDLNAKVPKLFSGKKQPYRKFLEEVRSKLVALGFKEMDGPVVESEFWNMDALFMPQFHSARDIHDAYYVKEPKYAKDLPKNLVNAVKEAHEKGIPGSKGWNYEFDVKKTSRLILRSHDTAISPRTLSSPDLKIPGKYFQISRCFRYDVIDATHNADFDQIGGFVVEENLTLRHLFGLLRLFARTFCQTDEIKVVPSYFPFTEPSVGLYAKHPEMGWIELAGAGMFRPEMLKPLGIDVPVIAWGIGLGRVAMFRLGLKDIRMLYSHDLKYLRNAKVI